MLRSSMLHLLSRIASAHPAQARAVAHFLNSATPAPKNTGNPDRKFFSIKNRSLLLKTGKLHGLSGHLAQRSLK
ncbi:hypothetical protein [Zoogloea dura]|uniref:Uncharacterized protein n=1 Tax=Zoogloea dura TaxID=2728840 RepID=A0A848G7A6_9RHOO|nr:hypothetical protein [Zoogloea dura]NML27052.1 hypothetical protein [Zoogloea dura]